MTIARRVGNEELALAWVIVGPMLEKAIPPSDGNIFLIDVLYRILSGSDQLWVAENDQGIVGCAVTQVLVFPRKKVLSITFVAGSDLETWKYHEAMLVKFAKEQGCTALEGYARQGWSRRAPDGWYPVYTVIRKAVD